MSKKEIMKKMLDGKVFIDDSGYKFYFDGDDFVIEFLDGTITELVNAWVNCNKWEEIIPWYENIDKPILCWIMDSEFCMNAVDFIDEYRPYRDHKFANNKRGVCYKEVVPVSKREIDEFIIGV